MVDRVHYEWRHGKTTSEVAPEDWSHDDGLLRLDLEDETLFIPFERLLWIRRDVDDHEDV